jgi:putative FmdB family regulatory protein
MPLFDFRCDDCGCVRELLMPHAQLRTTEQFCPKCGQTMQRCASAPSQFSVTGFNSTNGYSPARSISKRVGHVKTNVSGNFEAFSDGLHK